MFNKYYNDELMYLRELGREFCFANPDAAPFLAEAGSDPDVERMLEGFAFLTARIRQKLDDELPEITHALLEMFWPHYLRPIPSTSIVQFEPMPAAARESFTVRRGVELDAQPVDGTSARFRTIYDVPLVPVKIHQVQLRRETPPSIRITLNAAEGLTLANLDLAKVQLRFHLSGEPQVTRSLYLCLCRYLDKVMVRPVNAPPDQPSIPLPRATVTPVGFADNQTMLPYPGTSFPGYRLLQEYFAYPAKFMFLDVTGLHEVAQLGAVRGFELVFQLSHLPENVPMVSAANILLGCTPVVNLFERDGDPIRVDLKRTEYKVRPAGADAAHYEIYQIKNVVGLTKGTAKQRIYRPLFKPSHDASVKGMFYRARTQHAIAGDGTDVFLSFVNNDSEESLSDVETISLELICSNRQLPTKLGIGDINKPTSTSPPNMTFKNISRASASIPPPLGGDTYWRLLSHLSLNYLSLLEVSSLRGILSLYNFRARVDRQAEHAHRRMLEGLLRIESDPATRLFQGVPVRGVSINLDVLEENFATEGDMYLFSAVLNEFVTQCVTLNAFSQFKVKGEKFGEVHQFPPRIGRRIVL